MLSDFDALLCKAAAHAADRRQCSEDDADCSLFAVSEVVNSTGGRTGCFLYRGRLLTPAPRSSTPDCCPWPRAGTPASDLEDQRLVPQLGGLDGEEQEPNWSGLEGQELTLYLSYEEASPKMKRRMAVARAPAAPWRMELRDSGDELVFSARGLPMRVQVDEVASLAVWGATLAVAFPSAEDARAFADGVCAVEVQRCCLAGSSPAALLQAHLAEGAVHGAKPAMHAVSDVHAVTAMPVGAAVSPPSPDLLAAQPRVGAKRPASLDLPSELCTPAVRARLLSSSAMVTPPCPPGGLSLDDRVLRHRTA